ncbi:MAG TPA: SRPBCC domain-containing protein [Puia sp.]|nr:SRPBCC domain-containing protein [Puia sp.]
MERFGNYLAPATLRFERMLPGPIEKVWAYLTESDKRGLWLARGEMELFEGGKVRLCFVHSELSPEAGPIPEKFREMDSGHSFTGTVLRVNAPYLLTFTWEGGSEVSFELEKEQGMVRLTLTHRKLDTGQMSAAPGWHAHLDILDKQLHGQTPDNFWKSFLELEALYQKRLKPQAETGMLIRRPVAEVSEAFVDPAITTKFWFTKSTGKLEKGKAVQWIWEMYDVTSYVRVLDLVADNRIEIEWGGVDKDRTRVEWTFRPMGADATFVNIVMDGFEGDEQRILEQVSGSASGFCWVLAGLKAWLEFKVQLNLVGDRFPTGKH